MIKKIPKRLLGVIFVFVLCFVFSTGAASAQYWTEDSSTSTLYPTDITERVSIGTDDSSNHSFTAQANYNEDGFVFRGYTGLTGERDILTIYDNDVQGAWQDESSVFKILRYQPFHDDADGSSLAELTFQGDVPGVEDRQFYMLGRGGPASNEAEVSWGISANDSDFWTIGDIHGGATGTDCGGTGAACFNSPTYELSASGDSYINGGNLGIGNAAPTEALDVTGNVVASGTICDSTGCIGSGSGGTSVWTLAGSDTYYDAGNVGIGTTSPLASLHVIGDEGALFTGTYGTGAIPAEGGGTRMMWYPGKAAFRAGGVYDTSWDDTSIGDYSMATGYNTVASGDNSVAMGSYTNATGNYSMAMGYTVDATGWGSVAMGQATEASGSHSIAMGTGSIASGSVSTAFGSSADATGADAVALGNSVVASGDQSLALGGSTEAIGSYSIAANNRTDATGDVATALGYRTTAQSYGSLVIGRYNDIAGTDWSWRSSDPVFVVGNGDSSTVTNNALTVYKDGDMDLDGDLTSTGQICDSTGCIGSSSSSGTGGVWATSGSDIYYNGGYVAIGDTPDSNYQLYLKDDGGNKALRASSTTNIGVHASSTDSNAVYATTNSSSEGAIEAMNYSTGPALEAFNNSGGDAAWLTGDVIVDSGNVGIGTWNPTEALDVDGNINVSGDIMSDGVMCIGSGC